MSPSICLSSVSRPWLAFDRPRSRGSGPGVRPPASASASARLAPESDLDETKSPPALAPVVGSSRLNEYHCGRRREKDEEIGKQQQASCKKPLASEEKAVRGSSKRDLRSAASTRLLPVVKSLLFLVSLSLYWNSLDCDFVFDDVTAVKTNKDLRPHSAWTNLMVNDFWGTPMHKERSHKSYRPLTVLTFRLNYAWAQLEPVTYHLVNVLLHASVTLLYHSVCQALTKSDLVSLVASLLFALHPVHTEAVTGVVGRAELLSSLFFLSALLVYFKAAKAKKQQNWKATLTTVVLATLAMLSKEQGITVLALCGLYELVYVQKATTWLRVWQQKSFKSVIVSKSFNLSFQRLGLLFTSGLVMLLVRLKLMGGSLPTFTRFDNPGAAAPTPARQLTQHYLVSLNWWLLLSPVSLCCDWTMNTVPLVVSFLDLRNVATLATYAGLAWLLVTLRSRVVAMALGLLILPFLPASNLFFPVGFVLAERVLYLPSMGFCLLISLGFGQVGRKLESNPLLRSLWIGSLALLMVSHASKTFTRNWDWQNELSIFSSGLTVAPSNAKLFNNVGHALEAVGKYEQALRYFEHAARVQPDDIGAMQNIGRTFNNLKRFGEAEAAYRRAKAMLPKPIPGQAYDTRLAPNHLNVFVSLATLISRNGTRLEEADQLYRQAISMRKDYVQAYINRGDILIKMNKTDEAEEVYEEALNYESDNPDLLYNMAVVKLNLNKVSEAMSYLDQALHFDPEHPQALLNSAVLIQESGATHLRGVALERLQKVVQSGEVNERVFFNLGMLSMDEGNPKAAEDHFKHAIAIKADFRPALFNLALLLSESEHPLAGEPYLRQLLTHYPDHVKGLILLGDLYINQLGDLASAEQCYRRILQIDPVNVQALHNLCVVKVELGQLTEAVACLRQARHLAPHEGYIAKHLHIVEKRLEREAEAKVEAGAGAQ